MDGLNHTIIGIRTVRFAEYHQSNVIIEDLENRRQTMKQTPKSRLEASQSR